MLQIIKTLLEPVARVVKRIRFHLFFTEIPVGDVCCNSKKIVVIRYPPAIAENRRFLVFIRCGEQHLLDDDGVEPDFDIALNCYTNRVPDRAEVSEYFIAGGLNKYKAAYQFIDDALLSKYGGFMFLDDDLKITYSELNGFLRYCEVNKLQLAQTSLTPDSHISHAHLVNQSETGQREVEMIEVMCPYFSDEALRKVISTFDLSYSTWGIDYLWPRLLGSRPVVVDEFQIKHTRPVDHASQFYKYMKSIGISPPRELARIRSMPLHKLR